MFLRMRQPLLRKQHLDRIKNSSLKLEVFIEFRIRFVYDLIHITCNKLLLFAGQIQGRNKPLDVGQIVGMNNPQVTTSILKGL